MNHLARWMMRLYPVRWRKRYGDELDALLTDTGADARIVADLAKGGIRMQFSTWSFLKLALVLASAGMLAGLGYSLFTPTSYIAKTELHLTGAESAVPAFQRLQAELMTRWRLSTVITDPALQLYPEERRAAPLDDVIEQMRRDVSITLDDASKISIRFAYPDRQKAELAVRLLSANAADLINEAHGADGYQDRLDVLEVASLPTRALRPDARITGAIGIAVALLLALPFRSTRRRIPLLTVIGAVAGAVSAWMIPSLLASQTQIAELVPLRYESHMTMYSVRADPAFAAELVAQVSSRTVMAAIIADPRLMLYRDQQKSRDLTEIADTMRRDLTVTTHKSAFAQMFEISFVYSDRFRVQQVVEAISNRMLEAYEKQARLGNITLAAPSKWGVLADAANPRIAIDAVTPDRERPTVFGIAVGLTLAAIIALVRRRWSPENDEDAVLSPRPPSRFAGARFRKLALSLAAAGIAIGAAVAIATPPRYSSEASFVLHNVDRSSAATLTGEAIGRVWGEIAEAQGLDPTVAQRSLTWHEAASMGTRFQRFDIRFVSDRPHRAWLVLDRILGAVDRSVGSMKGTEATPYETIRGVDGALLPIPAEHYSRPEVLNSAAANPDYTKIDGIDGSLVGAMKPYKLPATAVSATVTSEGEAFETAVPATERPGDLSIPFDDDHARPVAAKQSNVQMEVIDSPSIPTRSEGLGWWTVAIGAAVGLVLAMLITIVSGFPSGPALRVVAAE